MPGVIGGNGGNFVLVAATLLLHGWVDNGKARIAIAPGAPTSALRPALAARVQGKSDVKIELRAESFRAPVAAVEPSPAGDADMRLGQDVLDTQPILIDFPHHAVEPLSRSEARRIERGFAPVAVERVAEGGWSVMLATNSGPPVHAVLDLSSPTGVTAPGLNGRDAITLGGTALNKVDIAEGPQPVVGLYAFRHMKVIFDLAHDRIWVRG